jgi:cytochrome c biogenesis protein
MRFAISVFTVMIIASIVGTVLKQNEPYTNYIIQFGQFWFAAFEKLGLYDVYHSGWYLVILGFLVVSTSLCVSRNTPSMLREMRAWREHVTEASLRLFNHKHEYTTSQPADMSKLHQFFAANGFRYRTLPRNDGTLLVAKAGSGHRLGYIFTHSAIIIICLGGLMDGNLWLKAQEMMGHIKIEDRDIPVSAVPAISRLAASNPSFRGNMTIPEGGRGSVAYLRVRDGYLIQELPFSIALKKFSIEHYATGQPKSFASDVVIFDPARDKPIEATIKVNHPLTYNGIAIYQSDVQDGGSAITFTGWPLAGSDAKPFTVNGEVFKSNKLATAAEPLTLEVEDFRIFNVLNLSLKGKPQNVGPSITYKLRDTQGQAHEYMNYMMPMQLGGRFYLVSGMRGAPNEDYRYLRFPLDEDNDISGFMRWRALMSDPAQQKIVASKLADRAFVGKKMDDDLHDKFATSVTQLMHLFASGGFNAIASFIDKAVPAAEQEKAATSYIKILESAAFETYIISQNQAGKTPKADAAAANFVQDGLSALSDSFFYGAPYYLQMSDFKQRQASGLQLTRSPGKNWVYGGSLLLVIGIFAMLFIRERRIWLLVKSDKVLFAMSAARKSREFETEFARFKGRLQQILES